MVDLTIKQGLVDESGKPVNGNYISNAGPLDKIIYTGSSSEEVITIQKWAKAAKAQFEQKSGSSYKSKVIEPVVD